MKSTTDINLPKDKKSKETKIPKAIREQVWIEFIGKNFESKCYIKWCKNTITPFNFHVGHNKPKSKNGTCEIKNLKPICISCNLSMSNNYTIDQWNKLSKKYCNKTCIIL